MSFDPCFLRLSVPEVDLLTRAGGPNGWSVGRVVESLERPALRFPVVSIVLNCEVL